MDPDWCGSVGKGALSFKAKGCQFHSQAGQMPRMWARSKVGGVCDATS